MIPIVRCPCGASLRFSTAQGIDEGANRIALVEMTVEPCDNQYCTERRNVADESHHERQAEPEPEAS